MKNKLLKILSAITMVLLTPTTVFADGGLTDGSLSEALTILNPVTSKIGPIASAGINVGFVVFGVVYVVKAVKAFMEWRGTENPNEANTYKKAFINDLVVVAVAVAGGLIVNAFLAIFGLGGIFHVA